MPPSETARRPEPLVVATHVTPWGFLVALPLALGYAFAGALALDASLGVGDTATFANSPVWIFSVPMLAFSLFLFLVGVSELASYIRPSVAVVVDEAGLHAYGLTGERVLPWSALTGMTLGRGQLELSFRRAGGRPPRHVRLPFNRLAIEPIDLISAIGRHRPDALAGLPLV